MTDIESLQRELEEIRAALKTLTPGSRAHRNLEKECAALEAQLTGSGALAQGEGAKAAGAQAVMVDGSVGGGINTGTVNYFFTRYEAPAGKAHLSKDEFERTLREYLA